MYVRRSGPCWRFWSGECWPDAIKCECSSWEMTDEQHYLYRRADRGGLDNSLFPRSAVSPRYDTGWSSLSLFWHASPRCPNRGDHGARHQDFRERGLSLRQPIRIAALQPRSAGPRHNSAHGAATRLPTLAGSRTAKACGLGESFMRFARINVALERAAEGFTHGQGRSGSRLLPI
jgi:hypothetical protein